MGVRNAGWALVTGASSGLGVALAHGLAARGSDIVLTARRETPMRDLAAELKGRHGIEVVVEPADLGVPDGPSALLHRLDARGIDPDVLVNNAGFGLSGTRVSTKPPGFARRRRRGGRCCRPPRPPGSGSTPCMPAGRASSPGASTVSWPSAIASPRAIFRPRWRSACGRDDGDG